MREEIIRYSFKRIKKDSKKEKQGVGLCPHCRQYQNWMVEKSRTTRIRVGAIVGVISGFYLGVFSANLYAKNDDVLAIIVAITMAVVCCIIGWSIGSYNALNYGPYPVEFQDHGSMKDEEILELIKTSQDDNLNPLFAWHLAVGRKFFQKDMKITLGFTDEIGDLNLPHELKTEYLVDQFEESIQNKSLTEENKACPQ
ncbi:MAG: hypothetical protein JXR97_13820 [Planctomycetes bacterium]|nr:hypothetical protein [Planctomycetota bacterium]